VHFVSKISNLCDHNPPTSQTDGQTDRQTDDMRSQYRAMRYSASRGKKERGTVPGVHKLLANYQSGG